MTDSGSARLRSAIKRTFEQSAERVEEKIGWSIEDLDWSDRVEAALDGDGLLESAKLVINRWPWRSEEERILELIAQFLRAFPSECEARVGLACGALDTPGRAGEVPQDAPDDYRALWGDPVEAMRNVIAGRRPSAQTAMLSVTNWSCGEQSRLEIEGFVTPRFIIGRWPPEPSIPWAEEQWRPHPTDGDDVAVVIRRTVAAACTGDSEPGAAAHVIAEAGQAVPDHGPLGQFASRAHGLLVRWDTGELGTAHALHALAAELDAGPDTAWPMTLRERIRRNVSTVWVPFEWVAEALEEPGRSPADEPRRVARNAAVRFLVAAHEGPDSDAAADAFLAELRPLHSDEQALVDDELARYLPDAEKAVRQYHEGEVTLEELIEVVVDRLVREVRF